MIKQKDLIDILEEALVSLGGEGKIVEICEYIWGKYKDEFLLQASYLAILPENVFQANIKSAKQDYYSQGW